MASLQELARKIPNDPSPNQALVWLFQKKHISGAALRAMSANLQKQIKSGGRDPLDATLAEYAAGEIAVVKPLAGDAKRPSLADVDRTASPKQKLVLLYKAGSLTQQQVREAAKHLDEHGDLALALHEVKATHLLPPQVQEGLREKEEEDAPRQPIDLAFIEGLSPEEFAKLDYRRAVEVVELAPVERLYDFQMAEEARTRGPRPTVIAALNAREE